MTTKINIEELEDIKQKIQTANSEFKQLQDSLLEIKSNLEKNEKIKSALIAENEDLQNKINALQISEMGEINFSGFDEISDSINSNNRKIEVINNTINTFSKKLELSLLTNYSKLSSNNSNLYKKAFHLISEYLLKLLINDKDFIFKLNEIYCLMRKSDNYSIINNNKLTNKQPKEIFLSLLHDELLHLLNDEHVINDYGFEILEAEIDIPTLQGSYKDRINHLDRLRQ